MKMAKHAAFAALLLIASGAAQATLVSAGLNDPLNFTWSYNTGSSLLTGYGSMTISGFNTSQLTVLTSLTNTSALGGHGGERLVSFGFGIDPNATGVSFSDAHDGGMIGAVRNTGGNTSIPSLHSVIEICAYGGPNCSGGGNGGIYGAGGSDSFTLLLAGTWGSSVNIDPIGFKYQTGYGSFEFTTNSSSSSSTTTSSTSTSSSSTSTSSSGGSTSSSSTSGGSTSSTSSSGGSTSSSSSGGSTSSSSSGGSTSSSSSGGSTSSSSSSTSSSSTSSSSTSSTSSGGSTSSTSSGTVAEPGTGSMTLLALGLLGFALRRTERLKQI